MSRADYSDDNDDPLALGRWRQAVAMAIQGRRGQAFLRELIEALDAMPEKRLIADALRTREGAFCALGVVGARRGIDLDAIDPDDAESIHLPFGIANAMAREIEYINDEAGPHSQTPEHRWARVRAWAVAQLKASPEGPTNG
ncbi:MAG: hypothetical protein WA210_00830 [Burkholderiaceae bacterium]